MGIYKRRIPNRYIFYSKRNRILHSRKKGNSIHKFHFRLLLRRTRNLPRNHQTILRKMLHRRVIPHPTNRRIQKINERKPRRKPKNAKFSSPKSHLFFEIRKRFKKARILKKYKKNRLKRVSPRQKS